MRIPRIFTDQSLNTGAELRLGEQTAQHVGRVLRLRPGAPIILFNGQGNEFDATLELVSKRETRVRVGPGRAPVTESPLDLTLVQCISKGDRMDLTVQKAVELGVTNIVPVVSERTVVQLKGEREQRRLEHWRSIIRHACEQCGRNTLPPMPDPVSLEDWLAQPLAGIGVVLDPAAGHGLGGLAAEDRPVTLLIGPEGGLSPRELDQARAAGYQGVRMGPRIMRTETAGLAAIGILQALWGDMR